MGDFGPTEKPVGSFESCKLASNYYEQYYRNKETYNGYRCIREDLIVKRKGLHERNKK
jgi:hypothetical protein